MPAGIYFVTYDNPAGGDYRRPLRTFDKVAEVERVAPKTTLRLIRRKGQRFADIQSAGARSVDPRKGSMLLFSSKTGRTYVLNNRGNRPGVWVRRDEG